MTEFEEVCTFLDWDSEFFGCRIGKVNGGRLSPETGSKVLAWCDENRIDCLYFLAEMGQDTIQAAEQLGFSLVDTRVTLDYRSENLSAAPVNEERIRSWEAADIEHLRKIASESFYTRFHADPRFPDDKCSELYAIWITKSCHGFADQVYVFNDDDNLPMGFITCSLKGPKGQIGLFGVAEGARGQGIGGKLLSQSLNWFASQGASTVEVVTQGRNIAGQRLYQKSGFRTRSVLLWYHHWSDERQ